MNAVKHFFDPFPPLHFCPNAYVLLSQNPYHHFESINFWIFKKFINKRKPEIKNLLKILNGTNSSLLFYSSYETGQSKDLNWDT